MKKLLLLLTLLCLLPAAALGDGEMSRYAITDGTVQAVEYVSLTAPYTGTLSAFDLDPGDRVAKGDVLLRLLTTDVTAPEAGTVSAVFVSAGSLAENAMRHYGAVIGLEPANKLQLKATTMGAYNDEENKRIRLGETLYFHTTGIKGVEGQGRVVSVSGNAYLVEITKGTYNLNTSLILYRSDSYDNKTNVGRGQVILRDPIPVAAVGRVARVNVKAGAAVKEGQVLLQMMAADADAGARPEVAAPADGIVAAVSVIPGQMVWKGQELCRLWLTDRLEIVADVDEMYVRNVQVGDRVPCTLDVNPSQVLEGEITEISSLGVPKQNTTTFTVHIAIQAENVRLGSGASVYMPR